MGVRLLRREGEPRLGDLQTSKVTALKYHILTSARPLDSFSLSVPKIVRCHQYYGKRTNGGVPFEFLSLHLLVALVGRID